jgi:nucleoside-specific outer membrane channel protein Tsx
MSRIPQSVIDEVVERSGGYCELGGCQVQVGGYMKFDFHHREAYQMGSTSPDREARLNVAGNVILLHDVCHSYVHRHPAWARCYGYIISQYEPSDEVAE